MVVPPTRLPKRPDLVAQLSEACERLVVRFSALDLEALEISDYSRRYLGQKLAGLSGNLTTLSWILAWALSPFEGSLQEVGLIDYGAGTGVLAMLAKEAGVGTVVYNDIYDLSARDAARIADALGLRLDGYVVGEVSEIADWLSTNGKSCQVMVSSDVIEHIYDIDQHWRELDQRLQLESLCLATDANPRNPLRRRAIAALQIEAEHHDRVAEYGHKERDALRSFQEMRREMIGQADPSLPPDIVDDLVARTRGMARWDIAQAIDQYRRTGNLPPLPHHPTNTCDPNTGNWMERLTDPAELARGLARVGFTVNILPGFYGRPQSRLKRLVANGLNTGLRVLGRRGLWFSPQFALWAWRRPRI